MSLETPPRLQWRDAVIERVEPLTPRIKSFFFRTSLPRPLAGQHVDVKLTAPEGYTAERSYSIASAPEAELLELAIEKLEDGEVSGFFHDVAAPGDVISLRGPIGGHFVWRAGDGGPLLLVAGGSGIAPLMAMLRHRKEAAVEVPSLLLYSVRSLEDLAYSRELTAMELEDESLKVVFAITRGKAERPGDYGRRFDSDALATSLEQWGFRPARSYVCGSNAFAGAMSDALVGLAIPSATIRVERFGS